MTEFHLISKNLPLEILHHIFRKATTKDLCNFALVCKTWLYPAQASLYSFISISNVSQLKKLHQAVKYNNFLGILVKDFSIAIYSETRLIEVSNFVSSLLYKYLPNLEQFYDCTLNSYIPILDALTDSKLGKLKNLVDPSFTSNTTEVEHYVTCALLMKNRLKSLIITDKFKFIIDNRGFDQLFFNRLYNKLDQFDQLTIIDIRRKTNDEVEILENIIESCKSLKKITISFEPYDDHAPFNSNIDIDAITRFTPRPNIKKLINEAPEIYDDRTLLYIMHKFPCLDYFDFQSDDYRLPHKLNHHTATQLLHFLSNIKGYEAIGLKIDEDTIGRSFQNYWQTTSSFGSEALVISYTPCAHEKTLDMSRYSKVTEKIVNFSLNLDWKHFAFVEKIGKYLKEIRLRLNEDEDEILEVPERFTDHIITFCPYLRTLHICGCTFERYSISTTIAFNPEFSLDELYLDKCNWGADFLEHWSRLVPKINQLHLTYCKQVVHAGGNTTSLNEINMKFTEIERIFLKNKYDSSPYYLKLVVVHENDQCYYHRNNSDDLKKMEASNEQEYVEARNNRIDIHCRTKPVIVIE